MYSSISEATSIKKRTSRIWNVLMTILPVITFLSLIITIMSTHNPAVSNNNSDYKLPIMLLIALTCGILLLINTFGLTYYSGLDKYDDASVFEIFYQSCKKLQIFNLIATSITITFLSILANGKDAIEKTNKIILSLWNPLSKFMSIFIPILIIFIFVLLMSPSIRKLVMWLSWNGYNDKFIAVTRKGNIRKYNKINTIAEKLPLSATPDEIASAISKNKKLVDAAYPKKWEFITL